MPPPCRLHTLLFIGTLLSFFAGNAYRRCSDGGRSSFFRFTFGRVCDINMIRLRVRGGSRKLLSYEAGVLFFSPAGALVIKVAGAFILPGCRRTVGCASVWRRVRSAYLSAINQVFTGICPALFAGTVRCQLSDFLRQLYFFCNYWREYALKDIFVGSIIPSKIYSIAE